MSKPDSKRGRQELSSSDDVDISVPAEMRQIRETMETIQQQLTQLDLLKKLNNDVEDLKTSLDFQISLVEVLKEDNASLRKEVNHLKHLTAQLQYDSITAQNHILDLQCRSMRDNFIIHGLPEQQKETYQTTDKLVKSFFKTNLKMDDDLVQQIHLARAHRLGQQNDKSPRCRPIVAKLLDPRHKATIMGKAKELKGSGLGLSDQFPPEIMRRRKSLQPILAEARAAGKRARLSVDKLYIDGFLYRNSKITYWLTGGDEQPHAPPVEVNAVARN
ncbi:hypothetical protein WMY93_016001 [Mugilogobius chulae]|uniref:Uncharacterized protein n=1 Tax=Mugilogobius chulae TaxID=88201 RepID=A0AAW0NWD8_9GOBI